MNTFTQMRRLACVGILLGAIGSASAAAGSERASAPDFVSQKAPLPAAGDHVVLVPNPQTDPVLARGQSQIMSELARQLQAGNIRVSVLDESSLKDIWGAAMTELGGIYDSSTGGFDAARYARALSYLAETICDQSRCTHIVKAQFAFPDVQVNGRSAEWDGVSRRLPIDRSGGADSTFRGTIRGLSVAVIGLTASGQVAFRTTGGAALPFDADLIETKTKLRSGLFDTPDEVSEGVGVALRPVFNQTRASAQR